MGAAERAVGGQIARCGAPEVANGRCREEHRQQAADGGHLDGPALSRLPQAAGTAQVARPQRRTERLQVRLTRGVGVERLRAAGFGDDQISL